jgi:energy-coupling factor transporter ATP-binding protein EcfA2
MMVGRPIENNLPRGPYKPGAPVLEVRGLQLMDSAGVSLLEDIGFTLRAGEIVAIAGVSGNGQSELMEILSGMRLPTGGAADFEGKPLPFKRGDADGLPLVFRKLGIAHVPEDRLRDGVVKNFSVMHNTFLGYQDHIKGRWGLFDFKHIAERCAGLLKRIRRAPAEPGPAYRPALRRQPAEGRHRPRGAGETEADAGGPAHARRRHRHHRGDPHAAARLARCRRGDPAGLRGTGRSTRAGRPHPRDVRRPHHRRTADQ